MPAVTGASGWVTADTSGARPTVTGASTGITAPVTGATAR